jgi:oligopeptide/dipeptide ABC transporter ATP-binding protein
MQLSTQRAGYCEEQALTEKLRIPPRVAVDHLTVEFATRSGFGGRAQPAFRAVDDVSFAIAPGETLGLVGESGSGKTTVGRTLVNLIRPTQGHITITGQNVATLSRAQSLDLSRTIQMVFQDPYGALNPRFSVERTIAEVLRFHKVVSETEIGAEVRRMMAVVGLSHSLAGRQPRHLSGGQRQRVGLARALAVRPSVLVLDEPVAALDVSIQAQVLNLLRDLRAELDLTMLFIAHELSVVRYLSDRVAVMYRGSIVEIGTSAEIFASPRHPYTRSLLEAMPRLVPEKRSRPPVLATEGQSGLEQGCRFRARCPTATAICATIPPTRQLSATHSAACHFAN